MARIGFIGLGNMGLPMAKNLIGAGNDVTGFDLSETVLAQLTDAGGKRADTPADAVSNAEIVVTALPAARNVKAVYTGEDGILASAPKGTTFIDCSTIDVDSARAVIAEAEDRGQLMIDSPMSGGVGGATAGTLTFMVGGTQEAFAAARPALEAMGQNIRHAGGPGAGSAAKICNNMMLAIQMIAVSEGFSLAQKLGAGCAETLRYLVDRNGAVLVAERLLPRARAGSSRSVEPCVSARFCRGPDAEGSANRNGSCPGRGRRDATGRTCHADLRNDGSCGTGRP